MLSTRDFSKKSILGKSIKINYFLTTDIDCNQYPMLREEPVRWLKPTLEVMDIENPPDARQPELIDVGGKVPDCWEVESLSEQSPSAAVAGDRLHQRLRYRLYGKQTVPLAPEAPALHALRAGGRTWSMRQFLNGVMA